MDQEETIACVLGLTQNIKQVYVMLYWYTLSLEIGLRNLWCFIHPKIKGTFQNNHSVILKTLQFKKHTSMVGEQFLTPEK